MAIRSYCQTHKARTVHKRGLCVECHPEKPKPPAEGTLVLELAPTVTALDVIRARGDLGATVAEIRKAGADPAELTDLEMASQIELRYRGRLIERDGAPVWFFVERDQREAA